MIKLWITCMAVLVGLAINVFAEEPNDIVIADFEGGDYVNWTVEGNAFGTAPAKGIHPSLKRVYGYEGKSLASSLVNGNDATGKLISPEFVVNRDYLVFAIGGGDCRNSALRLLIDGKEVIRHTGFNTSEMTWRSWTLTKWRGKKMRLEIIDDEKGEWGHINIDYIVLNNDARPPKVQLYNPIEIKTRELKITGKYLLVPTGTEGNNKHLVVKVGNTLVHNPLACLAYKPEDVLFWGHLDMSDYIGKTATLSYPAFPDDDPLKLFEMSDKERNLQPLYSEPARPQFHHSQKRGWSNDPVGMVYYDGEYHLFFDSNPLSWTHPGWENTNWGHSTSPDMVHWTEQTYAFRPYGGDITDRHPSMAVKECFSGSGNIDLYNTAGWQKGKEKTMVVVFTDTGCGESIAYSSDRGRTWTYDKKNPIIRHGGRDPKLVWYEPGKHWVIAVFDGEDRGGKEPGEENGGIAFFTSTDLHQWSFASKLYGFYECPELFELPLEGKQGTKRWVLFGADGRYFTKSFDGKRFTPDHKEKKALLHGSVYAGQCFSKPPDGRVVYIGWATFATKPGTSYNQHFTLPLHFTLHEEKASDGSIIHRIHINPVEELDKLHAKKLFNISGETITADNPKLTVDPQGDLLDITFTIRPVGNPETFKFQFGPDEFEYNLRDTRLRNHSAEPGRNHDILCPLQEGKLSMRILVDRPMYESFVNGGQFYLLTPRKMEERGKALTNMAFSFTGKEPADGIVIEKFQTHQMKSIWTKE